MEEDVSAITRKRGAVFWVYYLRFRDLKVLFLRLIKWFDLDFIEVLLFFLCLDLEISGIFCCFSSIEVFWLLFVFCVLI